jgi:phosphatidylserine decarboxylase
VTDRPSGTRGGDLLKSLPLYPLPHHLLSRLMFAITRYRGAWFKNRFIRWFCRHFRVNLEEAAERDPADFEHFNAFFTRALTPGARPIEGDADTIVSPADGHLSQCGVIKDGALFQAKGLHYSLEKLLGGDSGLRATFTGGAFATIYLSPRDYHRVHIPCPGTLRETRYIPGRLFSVAPHTTRTVPDLFARNERLVAVFDTPHGALAVILVGAIFVAAIETVWDGLVTPPHRRCIAHKRFAADARRFGRGEEIGRFNMGSTVILLFEPGRVTWDKALVPDIPLKMGQSIGRSLS